MGGWGVGAPRSLSLSLNTHHLARRELEARRLGEPDGGGHALQGGRDVGQGVVELGGRGWRGGGGDGGREGAGSRWACFCVRSLYLFLLWRTPRSARCTTQRGRCAPCRTGERGKEAGRQRPRARARLASLFFFPSAHLERARPPLSLLSHPHHAHPFSLLPGAAATASRAARARWDGRMVRAGRQECVCVCVCAGEDAAMGAKQSERRPLSSVSQRRPDRPL